MTDEDPAPPDFAQLQDILNNIPYAKLLGIELESAEAGVATLGFSLRDDLKRNKGVAHGGAIASLIDTAFAFAILSLLPPDGHTVTVDMTISYLRPISEGRARATAKVVRAGRRIFTLSAEAFNDSGTLIATALSTYIRV